MTETLQRLQAAVLPRLRAFGASRALEALRRLAPLPWRVHG